MAVFAVLVAGCKVDAVVTVKVDDDGSGSVTASVTLDAEAVRAVETPTLKLRDAVRLDDLETAVPLSAALGAPVARRSRRVDYERR